MIEKETKSKQNVFRLYYTIATIYAAYIVYWVLITPLFQDYKLIQKTVPPRIWIINIMASFQMMWLGFVFFIIGICVFYGNSIMLFGKYGFESEIARRYKHIEKYTSELRKKKLKSAYDLIYKNKPVKEH